MNLATLDVGSGHPFAFRHSARLSAGDPLLERDLWRLASEPLRGVPIAGILGDQQAALVRASLPQAGRGQEHLRHRLLHADEHRRDAVRLVIRPLTTRRIQARRCETGLRARGLDRDHGRARAMAARQSRASSPKAPRSRRLARSVKDNGDVYFVPAFSGLYAPYWQESARGVIAGLTRYANKGHIARAALEATAFQMRDVLEAMVKDSKSQSRSCAATAAWSSMTFSCSSRPTFSTCRWCARKSSKRPRSAPLTRQASRPDTGRAPMTF